MAKAPNAYSISRLDMFFGNDAHAGCPFAFKKVYREKIARGDNEPMAIGRISHDLVANYLQRLIDIGLPTDWEWAEKSTPREAPNDVYEIWERFYQNFLLPPMTAPAVEKRLAFTREWKPTEFFSDDAFFRMVLDWTFMQESMIVIQDWKTSRMVPANIEKNLQLRVYGWGARQALYQDAQEILLRLYFLRYGVQREVLLLPQDLDTIPQELEEKIAIVEAEKYFDPNPGSFCGWCGVVPHCPVMSKALIPTDILCPVTREEAAKAAEVLLTLQRVAEEIRPHLKVWVQENGPIPVGDMIYGPSPTETWDLKSQVVADKLLEMGIDREAVWGLLRVTKTDLERFARKILPRQKDAQQQLIEAAKEGADIKIGESIGFIKNI